MPNHYRIVSNTAFVIRNFLTIINSSDNASITLSTGCQYCRDISSLKFACTSIIYLYLCNCQVTAESIGTSIQELLFCHFSPSMTKRNREITLTYNIVRSIF